MEHPTLRLERRMLRGGIHHLACVDEVGRGALAGPVSVGVVIVTAGSGRPPRGIQDSKLLSPSARLRVAPQIMKWAPAHAVGHASPQEIDGHGIVGALRIATLRALDSLPLVPDAILLDGSHDYLSATDQPSLFDTDGAPTIPPVRTVVKGDRRCVGIACASILAKCARDARMEELSHRYPDFQWDRNKGYGSPAHLEAIIRVGVTDQHRRTWRLPASV